MTRLWRPPRLAVCFLTVLAAVLLSLPTTAPAAASCPNEAMRAEQGQASLALPDCRAYELVSPGGQLRQNGRVARASLDGGAITYFSTHPATSAQSSGYFSLATRGAGGWSIQSVLPQADAAARFEGSCEQNVFFSPDLTRHVYEEGWFDPDEPARCKRSPNMVVPGEPFPHRNVFVRDVASGDSQLVNLTPPGIAPGNAKFHDASDDLSRVVFGEEAKLVPEAPDGYAFYLWSDGVVRLLTFLPDGTPVAGELVEAASRPGAAGNGFAPLTGALSADGRRAYFYAGGSLHLRENADRPQSPVFGGLCIEPELACTLAVDSSDGPDPGGGGVFWRATPDGSRVLFTSANRLTPDSTAAPGLADLYEYDVEADQLVDLTVSPSSAADVRGVSGASADGSRVYFVANGVLAPGASPGTCEGAEAPGQSCSLYLADHGSIEHIATLSRADRLTWQENPAATDPTRKPSTLRANVSPDGRFLAFLSIESPTGFDNHDAADPSLRNPQIYLYDADSGQLRCVSCPASGPPHDRFLTISSGGQYGSSSNPKWRLSSVTDDGRVFFDTTEALAATDVNGVADVYQYHEGQVRLISGGSHAGASRFLDASADGANVFFQTPQSLLASDEDSDNASLYSARIGGGFAEPAAEPPPCTGESCRSAAAPAPAPPVAGTTTYRGGKPAACRRKPHRSRCGKRPRRRHQRRRGQQRRPHAGAGLSGHVGHSGLEGAAATPQARIDPLASKPTPPMTGAVAANWHGTVAEPDVTFTAEPVVQVEDQWAYAHPKSATLEARVNPLGLETTCEAQYASDHDFQQSGFAAASSLPCVEGLDPVSSPRTVKAEVGGLQHSTAYHFRFVFHNQSGSLEAPEESFSTFGIESFSIKVVDAEGNPYTQAGGHPYESITRYAFNHTFVPSQSGTAGSLNGFIKEVITELPVGRVNSTVATPRCQGYLVDEDRCSSDSQIGTVIVEYFEEGSTTRSTETRAMYNAFPPIGAASRYASVNPYTASDAHLRTGGDYGVTARDFNVSEEARVVGVTARIWGVPGDPRHDRERCPNQPLGCPFQAERKPLLRNPTHCGGPQIARARADTWQSPGEYASASSEMPATSGCDKVAFDPSLQWQPTTEAADSPSGLHINIHVPQNEDPDANSVADLKDAKLTLSKGLILNPSAANGLVGCSSQQIDLHGEGPARCPDASKVGLVEIRTPLLDHPLHGGIHIAEPDDNPFDSLFAIYLAVHDPETGIVVKLAGKIEADARDGQLTTSFLENPQLPVEDFNLDFFGGPRGVLRTPVACGSYVTEAELTPWSAPGSGPPASRSDSYRIASGPNGGACVGNDFAAPSAADVHAGTVDPVAGAYTPFVLHLRREDGTQQIADLRIEPPRGLLGRLAGLGRCSEAALAAAAGRSGRAELARSSCPAQSEVGRVDIGAGAGPMPYHVPGTVYLAGPHRGAPLSLAVVVPAVAGPFDLGTVVVRAGLRLDLESGRLEVESEPLPTFLEGVSLDVRSLDVRLDRPRFTVNPTSCAPMSIGIGTTSPFGQVSTFSAPFQVGRCGRLRFAPRLGLRLFGKTHRGAHPSLRAVLRMPEGGVNVAGVSVTLPPTQFLDQRHLRGICTREQFAAETCPAGSVYGYAKAWSPLLDAPLGGPVYLRSSNHRLPNLVADLGGELRYALNSRIDTARGGIRTRIEDAPDAPLSKFMLRMKGGGRGLLQNSTNVCRDPQRALVEFEAQDGRVKVLRPLLAGQCAAAGNERRGDG